MIKVSSFFLFFKSFCLRFFYYIVRVHIQRCKISIYRNSMILAFWHIGYYGLISITPALWHLVIMAWLSLAEEMVVTEGLMAWLVAGFFTAWFSLVGGTVVTEEAWSMAGFFTCPLKMGSPSVMLILVRRWVNLMQGSALVRRSASQSWEDTWWTWRRPFVT